MSPVGRVGINIAIQDAAAAANVLAGGISLKSKQLTEAISKRFSVPNPSTISDTVAEDFLVCQLRRRHGSLRRPLDYQL
jgi:hypothetical protein